MVMAKKKIADSIIIRVGGGIREVSREPVESKDSLEPIRQESDFEQTDDVHPFGNDIVTKMKAPLDEIVN
jgi:hypothetical protein